MRLIDQTSGPTPRNTAPKCKRAPLRARRGRAKAALPPLAALAAAAFASLPAPAAAADLVSFGAGLIGGVGGNFLDKPGDRQYGAQVDTLYPGFAGTSAAFGLFAEARVLGLVGLEVDFVTSSDYGSGNITLNNKEYSVEIGQRAFHLPVLAKGVLPLPVLAPFVVFGPEFVFASGSDASSDPSYPAALAARHDGYTMLTAGLGLEIKPPIPKLDLRIPFSLRASFNPNTPDNIGSRVHYAGGSGVLDATSANYLSEWKYRAYATVGVGIYFLQPRPERPRPC